MNLQLADFVINPWLKNNQPSFKDATAYIARGEEVAREILLDLKHKIALLTDGTV